MTDLTILDIPPGVKDGGVVHNLDIPRNQLLGDVEIRVFSQVCYCPAQSQCSKVLYLTLGGLTLRHNGHAVSALLQNILILGTCMQQQATVFTVMQGCHIQSLSCGFVACKHLLQGL